MHQEKSLAERLSIAVSAAGMGVFDWTVATDTLLWDDFLFNLYGVRRDQATGTSKDWSDRLQAETAAASTAAFAELIKASDEFRTSFRMNRLSDGKEFSVAIAGKVLRNEKGEVTRMIGMSWDCTREDTLKAEAARTRDFVDSILNAISDPIFVKNPDHRWIFFNQAFCDMIGKSRAEMLGKSDYDFFPKEMADHFWKIDNDVFRGGREIEVEEAVFASGEPRHILTKKRPVFDSQQKEQMLVGVIRDITERKRAEQVVRNLKQLVESSNDIFAIFDLEHRATYANATALELCGGGVLDKIDLRRGLEENWNFFLKEIRPQALRGEHWHGELTLNCPSEGSIPSSVSIFGIRNEDGTVGTIALIAKDIRSQINSRRAMLEQSKMAALGQLAGGIAHEINNPLAAVRGRLYIMRLGLESARKPEPDELLREIQTVDRLTVRISEIINALKVFSRKEPDAKLFEFPLNDVVREVATVSSDKLRITDCRLELNVPPDIRVLGRRVDLMQILVNLINNSCDAVSLLGERWVRVDARYLTKDSVELRVTDSGKGIPEDVAKRIMEPFFTTKDVGQGTGLGLSISRSLAENMGAELEYDREEKNTSFVVRLAKAKS